MLLYLNDSLLFAKTNNAGPRYNCKSGMMGNATPANNAIELTSRNIIHIHVQTPRLISKSSIQRLVTIDLCIQWQYWSEIKNW